MPKIKFTSVILLLSIGFIIASSCRKSWTCECDTYEGGVEYVIIEKAKDEEAKELCDSLVGIELNDEITRRCRIGAKYKGPTN
jgi:hypothetical protein